MNESSPQCIGFIMDGNRRWAKSRNLPTLEGHRRGADVFFDTLRFVRDAEIPNAVFYAFSSENWNRSKQEVEYLMNLFIERIDSFNETLENKEAKKKIRVRFIGDLEKFPDKLQAKIKKVETDTSIYTDTTIWIALSYGGRAEIISGVNSAVQNHTIVDEHSFRSLLWSGEMPDTDVIVRTGGEKRLSNFMTWHSVYSELIFIDTLWPDVTKVVLEQVVADYKTRKRNFGI